MMDFTRYVATRLRRLRTPQHAPIPGTAQVPNSAGGYAWAVDRWTRLDRFLVLGSEGGTFYVGERELTLENASAAADCLAEDAFYLAFATVEPSRKRTLLALDVSGSMDARILGMEYLTCREGAAAMALVTAAVEPEHRFVAFTSGPYPSLHAGFGSGLTPLAISPRQRLDDVVRSIGKLPFGGTDCALPMLEATKGRWKVDTFVVYTDSETWAGKVHPVQALREYRERMGIPAKLVVVGMASNGFSIADPEDGGMLDVVGFDASAPRMISDFAR